MADRSNQGALAADGCATTGWGTALANAARAAGPSLLFGFRLWASVCLALFVAFWLQLDEPYWAGASAAIISQPSLGASLRKARYRIIGTLSGAVMIVVLTAWFPQDSVGFFMGLALWCGICAFGATLFRNFASYAAALAGYTATIIAAGILGATGGPSSEVFMLAVTRASEVFIGIMCAGLVLAGTDFGTAPRRLAGMFAAVSADFAARFKSTLEAAGSGSLDVELPFRRELVRQVIALDPLMDQAIGESARLYHHSAILQAAVDGLFAALAAWRGIALRLARTRSGAAHAEAETVLRVLPPEFRSSLAPSETTAWLTDPVVLQHRFGSAVRTLVATPASTPSLRLLADQTAEVLAGFAAVLEALALLVSAPARPSSRGRSARIYVPDWLPSFINAGRAFVLIGAVELVWVATAWPNGGSAIVIVAIVVLLVSPKGELAYGGALVITLAVMASICAAAAVKFAVLPAIDTFPAFCLALGAFLMPVGIGLAQSRHPAISLAWSVMASSFLPVLQPANPMTYNTAQFYNTALGIFVGCVLVLISFLLIPALSPAFRARRLLASTLRDLRRLAIDRHPMDGEDWRGLICGRLGAMPDTAEPSQRAQLLSALSIGNELIWLRRIMPQLGLVPELESALKSLAQGESDLAIARLVSLDQQVASIAELKEKESLAVRAQGRILVVSDALAEHRAYFDTGGPP